jgi:DNA-binding transcriptional LysR family regulator
MNFPTYDLNLLKNYKALLLSRTLSEAAERSCISQPAMSRALVRLQHVFKDQLFFTSRNGIVPTPLSISLKGDVLDIVKKLEELPSESIIFDPLASHCSFNVYCSDMFMSSLASPLLEAINNKQLSVKINLFPTHLITATENPDAEEPDLLIIGTELHKSEITGAKLFEVPYKEFYCHMSGLG